VVGGLRPGDPQLVGPYRLVGQLGGGGMGRVFLGLSAGGRPVAVKVIRAELAGDLEFRVRFAREVAAARRVGGLFTALVVDADVDGPDPWLATAYVAGPSLAAAVTGYGPMPARPALALAAGLAEGLSAIHAAGVVHCDLKPSNVLLSQDGPRVIDFGISRAAEAASVTGAGWVVGSPGFMSPEQAMSEQIGPPSDVFSLGAVLTFAATGGGPFGKGSSPELAYRLVYSPPSLHLVPAELRPLIERCLVKDPAQRPTADEVLAAASTAQRAVGWLPDGALGPFARYISPNPVQAQAGDTAVPGGLQSPVPGGLQSPLPGGLQSPVPGGLQSPLPGGLRSPLPGGLRSPLPGGPAVLVPSPRQPFSLSRPAGPRRPGTLWRPLTAAGVAAGILAASVAVSFALGGGAGEPSVERLVHQPRATRTSAAPVSPAPVASTPRRPVPASPGPGPRPAIIPAAATATSPDTTTTAPPSATTSPATSPPASPSPSPSPTSSLSSPAPSVPPPSSPPPVPQIISVGTYQRANWSTLTFITATRAMTPKASASRASMASAGWRKPIPSPTPITASPARTASSIRST
jgi:eukaryotic-like serine/threonine-protein kinase